MNFSSNKKGSSFQLSPSQVSQFVQQLAVHPTILYKIDLNPYSSDEFSSPQGLGNQNNIQGNDSFDSPIPIKKPINSQKVSSKNQIESLNDRESNPQVNYQQQQKVNQDPSNFKGQSKALPQQDNYNMSFRNPSQQVEQNKGFQYKKTYTYEEVQQQNGQLKVLGQEAQRHDEQQNRLVGQIYGLNEQNKVLRKEITVSQLMQENLLKQMDQLRSERNTSQLTQNRSASQDDFLKREEEFRQAILHQDDTVRLDKWLDALKKVEKVRKEIKEKIRTLCNTNNQSIIRVNAKDLAYESKGALSPQKCQITYPNKLKESKYERSKTYGKKYDVYLKSKYDKVDEMHQINNAILLQKGQPTQYTIKKF